MKWGDLFKQLILGILILSAPIFTYAGGGGGGGGGCGDADRYVFDIEESCVGTTPTITLTWSVFEAHDGVDHFNVSRCSGTDCTDFVNLSGDLPPSQTSYTDSFAPSQSGEVYRYHPISSLCTDIRYMFYQVNDGIPPNTTVPTCSPPTADIKADGSDGPITISYNSSATISWSSTNATSCSVSPTGWSGTSGSQSTGNLTSSITYTLDCSGPTGSDSDQVTVNVGPEPKPDLVIVNPQISPATPQEPNTATFSASSNNNGTGSVGSTYQTRLRVDLNRNGWSSGEPEKIWTLPNQIAGGGDPVSHNWTSIQGDHRYEFCADYNNAITNELSESNNCTGWINFSVSAPALPDLDASISFVDPSSGCAPADCPVLSPPYNFTEGATNYGIRGTSNNIGSECAQPVSGDSGKPRVCVDHTDCLNSADPKESLFNLGTASSLPRVCPGNAESFRTGNLKDSIPAGSYVAYVCVDVNGNGVVAESSEGFASNCAEQGFTVLPPPQVCGNGTIEGTEVCDGSNMGGETCTSQGFDGGTLSCSSDCSSFDTSQCTFDPLGVVFAVNPDTGDAPLSTTAQADVSGGDPSDTINYSFWWDCPNTTTSVSSAEADPACGDLPTDPVGGGCTTNAKGAKCDAESVATLSVPHTYTTPSTYTAKVIIERGTETPVQDQHTVTVNIPPLSVSCTVDKTVALVNEEVIWSTTVTGGETPYVYNWSGSTPPLNIRTGSIESVSYSTVGSKIGQVRVTSNDAQDSGVISCAGSPIQVVQITFVATPRVINPGEDSILQWNTEGFDSCEIVDEDGNVIVPPGGPTDGSIEVSPTVTTDFTLTCEGPSGTRSDTETVVVSGAPRFREIPPSGNIWNLFGNNGFAGGIFNKFFKFSR